MLRIAAVVTLPFNSMTRFLTTLSGRVKTLPYECCKSIHLYYLNRSTDFISNFINIYMSQKLINVPGE